jgi:hypothetical protein
VTDGVLDEIKQFVAAVPPAGEASRQAARLRWEAPDPVSLILDPSDIGVDGATSAAGQSGQSSAGRGYSDLRRLSGRRRSLRVTTIALVACLLAVALVTGVAISRHAGVVSNRANAPVVARCSKGPDQLQIVDAQSGHGPYPLVSPYQYVSMRPVSPNGVPVSGLVAGRSVAVFLWRDGSWKPEAALPMPAPNSGNPPDDLAIVQFTSRYPSVGRFMLQVPFDTVRRASGQAFDTVRASAQVHSLLLCTTVVMARQAPGVTTTTGAG